MRKTLSILLLTALLFASVVPFWEQTAKAAIVTVFAEDFQTTSVGQVPPTWTASTGADLVGVVQDGTGNRYLASTENTNNVSNVASVNFSPLSSTATAVMRIMAQQTTGSAWFTLRDSNGNKAVELAFDQNRLARKLPNNTHSQMRTYTANQWYTIRVDINLASQNYSVAIDGTTYVTNAALMSTVADVSQFGFSTYRFQNGTFRVDDIVISGENAEPQASNVTISGSPTTGSTLTGHYTYSDAESDTEGATTFQWYRGTLANGSNRTSISGATSQTYTVTAGDKGQYLFFGVTPVAATGATPGAAVISASFLIPASAAYSENFQSTTVGQLPTGWTGTTGANAVAVAMDSGGNRYLSTTENANSVTNEAKVSITPLTDDVSLEMRIQAQQTTGSAWFTLRDSSGNKAVEIAFDQSRLAHKLPNNTHNTMQNYTANTWYNIRVEIDMSAQAYDVKVNGVTMVTGAALMSTVTNIAEFGVSTYRFQSGTFLVDDIVIAEEAYVPPPQDPNTRTGSWAMRYVSEGSGLWSGPHQVVNGLTTNTTYNVSAWIKGVSGIKLVANTTNWATMLGSSASVTANNTWQQVSFSFNSGSNTSIVLQIQSTVTGVGSLYIDDISLTASGGGANLILNPSFESGNTRWNEVKSPYFIVRPAIDPVPTPPAKPYYKGAWSTYEAEWGTLAGGATLRTHSPASDGKVIDLNAVGQNVQFTGTEGGNKLNLRYSTTAAGTISLYVNGSDAGNITLANTSGAYAELSMPISIASGATVKLQYDSGDTAIGFDLLRLYYQYEAESLTLAGGATSYADTYASGGNAVGVTSSSAQVTFTASMAIDELAIGYAATSSGNARLYVNGSHVKDIHFAASGAMSGQNAYYEQSVYLDIPSGAQVSVRSNAGVTSFNLDYIKVVPKKTYNSTYTSIPNNPTIIGAYVGNSVPGANQFMGWIGRNDIALLGYGGDASWTDFNNSISWAAGNAVWGQLNNRILWSVPLIPHERPMTGQYANLEDAAKGAYNARYKRAAEVLLSRNADFDEIYIRTAWEFNGGWFPWTIVAGSGEIQEKKLQDFIGAYRQFVKTFRSVSNKFRFDWCFNVGMPPLGPEGAYPGDNYVDIIGMDIYDEQNYSHISNPEERFQYALTRPYGMNWHRDFALTHNKKMAYSEWGVGGNGSGDSAVYMKLMYNWIASNDVVYQTYWNATSSYNGRLSDNQYPLAGAVYQNLFGSYTGSPPTTNTTGNVIVAVTSPLDRGEGGSEPIVTIMPTAFRGIALDPDGNSYVTGVTVTLQNASNQYINLTTGATSSSPINNTATYNGGTAYWSVSLGSISLPNGNYSLRVYANDGGSNMIGICNFTLGI
ncbi:glycosyl hydrolase [Paenibacillus koleovorans]|uniref:glycosyl hydrolase n=1 Tax=Paenibacillus koleovorans TaxID=121608 RepID=UPI000FD88059|nr:glycosyl hydrolase [Paenibacillus koleovorans]